MEESGKQGESLQQEEEDKKKKEDLLATCLEGEEQLEKSELNRLPPAGALYLDDFPVPATSSPSSMEPPAASMYGRRKVEKKRRKRLKQEKLSAQGQTEELKIGSEDEGAVHHDSSGSSSSSGDSS